ncbi:MAG: sulfurtransferase-like selenium metabolism protein YedF [Lachnospiraceae bacterium]|nr:sulfurtransferase-like selenium metabolism protein YedF [Lachnospiraceae bacterium]
MEKYLVDALGKACPIPVVMTKKKIQEVNGDGIIETHVDNLTAVENLKRLAASHGASAESAEIAPNHYTVTITASAKSAENAAAGKGQEVIDSCQIAPAEKKTNLVVVFDSAFMGKGDDKLGQILIKSFVYSLTQMDQLPAACLFYNGGAWLTSEGSACLADLKSLESQGTQILTCGTCADFYGIKDKIAVGGVTNMYAIVETMASADKIIRP